MISVSGLASSGAVQQRVVLITGISTGIGWATACRFLLHGALVFGSVRKSSDAAAVSKKILRKKFPGTFVPLIFDITDAAGVKKAARKVKGHLSAGNLGKGKKLDFLINNAGVILRSPFLLERWENFLRHFQVNVFGTALVTKEFLPLMLDFDSVGRSVASAASVVSSVAGAVKKSRNSGGRIIVVNSINGSQALPIQGSYCGSKFALSGLAASWDMELQMYGIRVISVCPGPIDTAMRLKVDRKDVQRIRKSDYGQRMEYLVRNYVDHARNRAHPDTVARKIFTACVSKWPAPRYVVTPKKLLYWWFPRLLPARLSQWLLRIR